MSNPLPASPFAGGGVYSLPWQGEGWGGVEVSNP